MIIAAALLINSFFNFFFQFSLLFSLPFIRSAHKRLLHYSLSLVTTFWERSSAPRNYVAPLSRLVHSLRSWSRHLLRKKIRATIQATLKSNIKYVVQPFFQIFSYSLSTKRTLNLKSSILNGLLYLSLSGNSHLYDGLLVSIANAFLIIDYGYSFWKLGVADDW